MGIFWLNVAITALVACCGVSNAQREDWMSLFSDGSSYYGFDLYSKTILEIMWPGSTNVGMYSSAMTNQSSSSEFATELDAQSKLSDEDRIGWSVRQYGSVLDQLNHGARFLQMQFEYDGTDYFSYTGYFGATASDIAANISTFVTAHPDELIILYFNNYLDDGSPNSELSALFDVFTGAIGTTVFSATATYTASDLTTTAIETLMGTGVKVIAFAEDTGSGSDYVYDSSLLTSYNRSDINDTSTYDGVRSSVIGALREGWDVDQLFLLYWGVEVDTSGVNLLASDSFFEYSRDLNYDLSDIIDSFPKLRFGNVILVDFFGASDTIDQVIRLNYDYGLCNDENDYWGTSSSDCPSEVNLRNEYSSSSTQSECSGFEAICNRSCGLCSYISGVPGASCANNSECDSAIYQADGDSSAATGTCYLTSDENSNFITEESFCLATSPFGACASTDDEDVCSSNSIDTTSCADGCASNYQCGSGYCSSVYGICMSFNSSAGVTTTGATYEGYDFVKSLTAILFRDDIEWLRPGNPDGTYSADFTDVSDPFTLMDSNPYLTSIIGFILIPFILSLFLFFCWFCTCCFWCLPCCEGCCKKCCCRMCLGPDPQENLVAKWLPCAILGAVMIVIIWACIEGIVYNSSMHDHIFSTSNSTNGDPSVRSEINDLFDDVIYKLADVEPTANEIIGEITDIIDYVVAAFTNTGELNDLVDDISSALTTLADVYSGNVTVSATVNDPFDFSETQNVSFTCDYCSSIGDTVVELNDTINTVIVDGLSELENAINSTDIVVEAKDSIDEALSEFTEIIDELVNTTKSIQAGADKAFESVEDIDSQREFGGFVFFTVPFVWVVFPLLGIFLGKWCFKINWCLAMFLGATVMLVLSFFAILSVGWADLCVRLDDFEQHLGNSDIGEQLGEFVDPNLTSQYYQVVNACFYGEDLLAVFDLDELLDFDAYRDEVSDSLDFDIASYFESQDFDVFETELDLLDTSTFTVVTDELIETLNEVDSSVCYCPVNNATSGVAFTRELILAHACSKNSSLTTSGATDHRDIYWNEVFNMSGGSDTDAGYALSCIYGYQAAYGYTFAEVALTSEIDDLIDGIKTAGNQITSAFDNIYLYALRLENVLVNITCKLDPLFDNFDVILRDYTNCAFIGDAYEGFKEVGCELLFSDMYHITRSMALIAFLSIMVVTCSMCMDYVKDPANSDDDLEDDEFGKKAALGSQTDPYSNNGGAEMVGATRPSYASGGTNQPGAEGDGTNGYV